MAADAHAGTCAVGHCTLAVVVQLLGDVVQLVASADGRLPGICVHGKVLHVGKVDDEGAVSAT